MLDELPSSINIPRQELKLSTQSTISNITSEKQYRRKINKVDEFLSKWNNSKTTITTKEKKKKTSKKWQQKEQNNSRNLQYMTEETSNDEESLPDLFYRENESDL